MKNHLIIIVILLLGITATAQVKLIEGSTIESLKQSARKENKKVLLLVCTEWCGPCKVLKEQFFKDSIMAAYINKDYVIGYFDAEKGYGIKVAMKYAINAYPTLIELDNDGYFYWSSTGACETSENYITTINSFRLHQKDALPGISNTINLNFPSFYINYYQSRYKPENTFEEVQKFLSQQKDLSSELAMNVMRTFKISDEFQNHVINNTPLYIRLFGLEFRFSIDKFMKEQFKQCLLKKDTSRAKSIIRIAEDEQVLAKADIIELKIQYALTLESFNEEFAVLLEEYFNDPGKLTYTIYEKLLSSQVSDRILFILTNHQLKLLDKDIKSVNAHLLLGLVYEKQGLFEKAKQSYSNAIANCSDSERLKDVLSRMNELRSNMAIQFNK